MESTDVKSTEDKILEELQSVFKIEAEEHIQALSSGLLELEKGSATEHAAIAENISRVTHSLKGAARAVDMHQVVDTCQALENVLAVVRRGELSPGSSELDMLHRGLDGITQLVSSPGEGASSRALESVLDLYDLAEQGQAATLPEAPAVEEMPAGATPSPARDRTPAGGETPTAEAEEQEGAVEAAASVTRPRTKGAGRQPARQASVKSEPSETIRISTAKLDSLLLKAEEMLSVKLTVEQCVADLQDVINTFSVWRKEWRKVDPKTQVARQTLRSEGNGHARAEARYENTRVAEFLDWNSVHFGATESSLKTLRNSLQRDIRSVVTTVDGLLEDAKKVLMLPCSSLLRTFPKMVRDIAREQEKEIDLELRGESVEIDKRILDEIKYPLIHLVRNCVDHGIEKPQQREQANKPSRATVTVAVSETRGDKVEILVSDDGAGIDLQKVKEAAIEQGLTPEADMEDLGSGF